MIFKVLVCICAVFICIWACGAYWFTLPIENTILKSAMLMLPAFTAVGLLAGLFFQQFQNTSWILFVLVFAGALISFFSRTPINDRQWAPELAQLPSADISGSKVTISNIRDFSYEGSEVSKENWITRDYDLNQLKSLDLFAVYWMGDAIAHTILSFGFGEEKVAISIEIRKEETEDFSALAGFFRHYELIYLVATERDVIGLRANHRTPPEDVYLYNIDIPAERIRELFLQYASTINGLKKKPNFYNTATTNCTTDIIRNVRLIDESYPRHWKILLSGYFPEFLHEQGFIQSDNDFETLKLQSYVNPKSNSQVNPTLYSHQIRE